MSQSDTAQQEAARIIRQFVEGTFNGDYDPARLGTYAWAVEAMIAQKDDVSRAWSTLGLTLSADPQLRQLVFGTGYKQEPGPSDERKRWYKASELRDLPRPKPLLEHYGIYLPQGLSLFYGPSGIGKSFVALDWAAKMAETGQVIYMAAERFRGYRERVAAWSKFHKLEVNDNLGFYDSDLDMLDTRAVSDWIAEAKRLGWTPSAVFIDTLAASIAGDDSKGEVMMKFLAACRQIAGGLSSSVIVVHHTGKEISRGPRGHNSLYSAADAVIQLTRKHDKTLELVNEKQSDAVEFDPVRLRLQLVDLGRDPKTNKPISSCVVVPSGQPAAKQPKIHLVGNQRLILEALAEATQGLTQKQLIEVTGITARSSVSESVKALIIKGYIQLSDPDIYETTAAGVQVLMDLGSSAAQAA